MGSLFLAPINICLENKLVNQFVLNELISVIFMRCRELGWMTLPLASSGKSFSNMRNAINNGPKRHKNSLYNIDMCI